MRIPRIFTTADLSVNHTICLDDKAYKHAKDVLRLKPGDQLILFNGDRNDYQGTIEQFTKKQLQVRIDIKTPKRNESSLEIFLLIPLCRTEKMDWCLQKATELGVVEITPVNSERVNFNIPSDRLEKKILHWQRVINSACEQSGRARIPKINKPISFMQALKLHNEHPLKVIASPSSHHSLMTLKPSCVKQCVGLIGPEGGFSDAELDQAEQAGFTAVSLGPRILRLETAVVTLNSLLQSRWGDLN